MINIDEVDQELFERAADRFAARAGGSSAADAKLRHLLEVFLKDLGIKMRLKTRQLIFPLINGCKAYQTPSMLAWIEHAYISFDDKDFWLAVPIVSSEQFDSFVSLNVGMDPPVATKRAGLFLLNRPPKPHEKDLIIEYTQWSS